MIMDILTVLGKELKELILPQPGSASRFRSGWLSLLSVAVVFGIFLPLQMGPAWVTSPGTLLFWAWVPLFLVSSATADSFAGERERHTLETLLASRLSDRAILFGKIAAAIVYGWGLTLICLGLGLVAVNLAYRANGPHFYAPAAVLGGFLLGFLAASLAATAGVLVSLRAATVRQASQTMSIAIMLLLFGGIYGYRALPAGGQAAFQRWVASASQLQLVGGLALGLTLVDLVLLVAALRRFQRARLVLD